MKNKNNYLSDAGASDSIEHSLGSDLITSVSLALSMIIWAKVDFGYN